MRRTWRRCDCSGSGLPNLLVALRILLALTVALRLTVPDLCGLFVCRGVGLVVSWSFDLVGVIDLFGNALSEANGDLLRRGGDFSDDDITPNSKLNIEPF